MCHFFLHFPFCSLFYLICQIRSLALLVTHSLTHSRLVILFDVALACEDTNLEFVEVVTVADVDDEDRIGNSLLQICGHKAKL